MPFMSRELLYSIPAGPEDPKPTEIQLMYNEGTIILFQYSLSELWFIVGSQSFPLHQRRRCDYLLENGDTIMKMLQFRPKISAEHFEEDQAILGDLILDFLGEVVEEYKRLLDFLFQIEEDLAFEGFRALFGLPDEEASEMTEEQKKVARYIDYRYHWVRTGGPSWLHEATLFYNNWQYVKTGPKNKILRRYAKN